MNSRFDVDALLNTLTEQLRPLVDPAATAMIGIFTGGVWVARALHHRLGLVLPLGELDISFYRDDFSRIGLHPEVRASRLPFDVEDRDILLVDDVLYTGRTVRAALNEIFDYGRPRRIRLVVLVDRCTRELPIAADFSALQLRLDSHHEIKLNGPEPLRLEVQARESGS
ncbi:MAG: bifunctional pyr operon transcriptional regulator/uracil phosphoribosyltransferase PyrR [Acidithiobacillus sp.]|uniref:bifunctional pyr operon transcriptional regulator/uracil phosphoribosyltransferase PyrR n=1 Tax=Acidithiobacillus sp. TaxID=1872118 RepID=UPI003CFC0F6E